MTGKRYRLFEELKRFSIDNESRNIKDLPDNNPLVIVESSMTFGRDLILLRGRIYDEVTNQEMEFKIQRSHNGLEFSYIQ